jgi:fucose permease
VARAGRVSAYIYLLFFIYGFSVTMIGPIIADLMAHYEVSYSGGGFFVTVRSIGGIAAMVFGGVLSDRVRKVHLIAGGFLVYVVTLLVSGGAPVLPLMHVAFFLMGAGTRYMDMAANAYIADIYPETKDRQLSLLHGFFGLGALLGPLYARLLADSASSWQVTYTTLGLVCAVALLPGLLIFRNAPRGLGAIGGRRPVGSILRSSSVWLLAAALFLYVAHQSGLTVWLPLYMETQLGVSKLLASGGLSMLWVGIVAGRFSTSAIGRRLTAKSILVGGHVIGGTVLTIASLAEWWPGLVAGVCVTGFATGAAYPLIVSMACGRHPSQSGAVTGVLFITGTTARMTFPWAVGVSAASHGLMPGIVATGLVLLIVAGLVALVPRSKPTAAPDGVL